MDVKRDDWNTRIQDKKDFEKWNAIGILATVLSVVGYIPPIIQLIVSPGTNQFPQYNLSLYVIAMTANIFWTTYGVGLKSLPLLVSSIITVLITLVFIILLYTL